MREINFLLLEHIMMYRNFDAGVVARVLQTMCMLFVLLLVGIVFQYCLSHGDLQSAAAIPPTESLSAAGLLSMPLP